MAHPHLTLERRDNVLVAHLDDGTAVVGETEVSIVGPDDYAVIAVGDCHVANLQAFGNGTRHGQTEVPSADWL